MIAAGQIRIFIVDYAANKNHQAVPLTRQTPSAARRGNGWTSLAVLAFGWMLQA